MVNFLNWLKPVNRVIDVVDKAVVDQDLRIQLKAELQSAQYDLQKLAQEVYVAELNTKTVPWVDATHKLGRQGLALLSMLGGWGIIVYMIHKGMDANQLVTAMLASHAPALGYNVVKGKGKPEL